MRGSWPRSDCRMPGLWLEDVTANKEEPSGGDSSR